MGVKKKKIDITGKNKENRGKDLSQFKFKLMKEPDPENDEDADEAMDKLSYKIGLSSKDYQILQELRLTKIRSNNLNTSMEKNYSYITGFPVSMINESMPEYLKLKYLRMIDPRVLSRSASEPKVELPDIQGDNNSNNNDDKNNNGKKINSEGDLNVKTIKNEIESDKEINNKKEISEPKINYNQTNTNNFPLIANRLSLKHKQVAKNKEKQLSEFDSPYFELYFYEYEKNLRNYLLEYCQKKKKEDQGNTKDKDISKEEKRKSK